MSGWRSWILPGAITTAILTILATFLSSAAIERDLTERSIAAVRETLGAWANIVFDGRDAIIRGTAPTPEAQTNVDHVVQDTWGVRVAANETTVLPLEAPYQVSVEKTAQGAVIRGYVPNDVARARLLEAVKAGLPGVTVAEHLRLARGAPQGLIDMTGFAVARLAELSTGAVKLTDATLDVTGTTGNFEAYDKVMGALKGPMPAALKVGAVDIKPPVMTPFVFGAALSEGRIRLTGYVPDAATRAALLERAGAIAGPGKVEDALKVAGGAPEAFAAAALFAVDQLARLSRGTVGLDGTGLTVAGTVADEATKTAVEEAVNGARPPGYTLANLKIDAVGIASPYRFQVAQTGKTLTLDGYVPDAETKTRLIEEARSYFGRLELKDELKIAAGAPEGFPTLVASLMQAASRLVDGTATLTDTKAAIKGTALTAPSLADIRQRLEQAFPGGAVDLAGLASPASLPPIAAPECQQAMLSVLALNTIRFETGKAVINPASLGMLDALSATVLRCPDAKVEISGHTDSDGSDEINRPLSKQRAEAVVAYLVAAGVAPERLSAQGFGADRPVVPNDTPENKARNRRIEFNVIAN